MHFQTVCIIPKQTLFHNLLQNSSLLKPPTLSPPPLTFRQFERPLDDNPPSLGAKIITHNEKIGSKTTTFSEKVCLSKTKNYFLTKTRISQVIPLPVSQKTEKPQNQEKFRGQRRRSWKLTGRPSLRRKKSRSGSDSEAIPLNNGRDHSQCNGGNVAKHVSLIKNN